MAQASPSVIECLKIAEGFKHELEASELEVKKAKEKLRVAQKKLGAAEEALATALESGTTGDWLRDQVIKGWGLDPAMEEAYRQVHKSLSGHKGELVLLSYDIEKRVPEGLFREESCHTVRQYRLGILDDDKLVLVQSARAGGSLVLGFPVTKFIEGESKPSLAFGMPSVIRGGLFDPLCHPRDPPHFMAYVGNIAGLPGCGLTSRVPPNVELVVGNRAVKAWLKTSAKASLYEKAAKALGMPEPVPA